MQDNRPILQDNRHWQESCKILQDNRRGSPSK